MAGTKGKRPSTPLLDPPTAATYKAAATDRLHEERATINNRLSGIRTQLGRLGRSEHDRDRKLELRARQDDLLKRRQLISDQLAGRADTIEVATRERATAAASGTDEPAEPVGTKRDWRKAAKAALDAAGVDEIAEDTYQLLEALQAFPAGATSREIADLAGTNGTPSNRLNALRAKGLADYDAETAIWTPATPEGAKV